MTKVDTAIDELYARPLAEFTEARNALAKTLDGADRARVKGLPKPSIVPWAINQVYWHARPVYDRVLKAGDRLRRAQIAALEGKSADVRSAADAHRAAIGEAVKEAERLAAEQGSNPATDALSRTLETLSLSATPRAEPGRLTEPLQPSGFEALAGVGMGGGEGKRQKEEGKRVGQVGKKEKEAETEERARIARDATAARERESAVKKAEAALVRAQAAERFAHEAWLRAQRDVDEVRQRLVRAKSER
jgi:hypothetical protein